MENVAVLGCFGTIGANFGSYLVSKGLNVYGVDPKVSKLEGVMDLGFRGVFGRFDEIPVSIDMVIEAVPERPELKASVLSGIWGLVGDNTYIVMVSSTQPSSQYVQYVRNPEMLVNGHILPDLEARKVIELQGCGKTNYRTLRYLSKLFSQGLGLQVVTINGESEGFIFNKIWHNCMFTSFGLMERYSIETIDNSVVKGLGWSYGPFMAMDLIGHDTLHDVFSIVAEKRGGSIPEPVVRLRQENKLGIKKQQGFYSYDLPGLGGLHKAAEDLKQKMAETPAVDEIVNAMKQCISVAAKELVAKGQNPEEVLKAIRYGFPSNFNPFL